MEKEEREKPLCLSEEKKSEAEIKNDEEEEEKWVTYYSSNHQILLVGDGDFSFSLSLANSFASASNIVASSLNSYDDVIKMYKEAKSNLENLKKLGAYLLHGVDATHMKLHTDLKMRKFDRIIFNFPHAGFYGKEDNPSLIKKHVKLMNGFFKNARPMLRPNGEIHVNHKTSAPFCCWDLEGIASENLLVLIACVDFKKEDYPGYKNKRGASSRCDEPFPLGECSTFKFRFSKNVAAKKRLHQHGHTCSVQISQAPHQHDLSIQHQQIIPNQMHQLSTLDFRYPQTEFVSNINGGTPIFRTRIQNDCRRIFNGYFTHVLGRYGKYDTDYDVRNSVYEALYHGYAIYMAEEPGRSLNEYIDMLEELHHISTQRSAWLTMKLMDFAR